LMAKYFKSNSRVLQFNCDDESVICGGITNPDQSTTLCLINLKPTAEKVALNTAFSIDKPMRAYQYVCGDVPYNEYNDLQGYTMVDPAAEGTYELTMEPHSLVLLTTDYTDRTPSAVKNVSAKGKRIKWDAVSDEEHAYYRVFKDGKQIGSTAATYLEREVDVKAKYTVKSVDKYGNMCK